ncbi:MAG TPA: VOC family protein [Thermoanaerobaculia bacterium]
MNVRQVVPFLRVSDMERSLRFYLDGLGFTKKLQWIDDGKLRWCWLDLGGASLMLQEGAGVTPGSMSLCFICEDALALHREFTSRGIDCSEPEVGNGMWVTGTSDPDGYRLEFESETDVPEDTKLSEL